MIELQLCHRRPNWRKLSLPEKKTETTQIFSALIFCERGNKEGRKERKNENSAAGKKISFRSFVSQSVSQSVRPRNSSIHLSVVLHVVLIRTHVCISTRAHIRANMSEGSMNLPRMLYYSMQRRGEMFCAIRPPLLRPPPPRSMMRNSLSRSLWGEKVAHCEEEENNEPARLMIDGNESRMRRGEREKNWQSRRKIAFCPSGRP